MSPEAQSRRRENVARRIKEKQEQLRRKQAGLSEADAQDAPRRGGSNSMWGAMKGQMATSTPRDSENAPQNGGRS